MGSDFYTAPKIYTLFKICPENETAEADFRNYLIKYFGKFEAVCETAFACEPGPQG
jgi:hypothetical protein